MPCIKIEGLPEGYELIKDAHKESYALILLEADVLRQSTMLPAIGKWNYKPSLEECNQQISALQELESGK